MPTLDLKGQPIHYLDSGEPDAPPVVLIHGAGGDARLWPEAQRQLPGARVIAADLPGHGGSPAPGRRRVGDYAAIVAELLRVLGLGNAVWVGHSLGGAIALHAAAHALAPISRLVILGSAATMRVGDTLFSLLSTDYEKAARFIVDFGFVAAAPDPARARCLEALIATLPMTTYGDFLACSQFDLRPRLMQVRQPTLVISGAADQLILPRFAAALAERLPHGRLLTLEGAGHFAMMEQPETVAAAVAAFALG